MRVLAGWLFLLHLPALAQSTQGIIAGRVTQADGGEPIAQASVAWKHTGSNAAGRVLTGKSGYYALLPLSPGVYVIRVDAAGFRAREAEVTLAVAGRVDLDFSLRPFLETMESAAAHAMTVQGGHYAVTLYGPDGMPTIAPMATPRTEMGLLDATRSQVIDPVEISNLPFFGRDVYTMLVTQPGTSSDGGTSRGLGFSVAGQRPAAANFLLDGAESNQYLLSGPLLPLPPEAIGEYRVSTSNFSAEYGFSAGYVANAVTRAGTNAWHGIGWWNWKNEAFGANGFQENRMGIRRSALREYQPGVQVGGPIRRDRYFVAGSLEYIHSFGHNAPVEINLPSAIFLELTASDSIARALLERFPRPLVAAGARLAAPLSVAQPVTLDRWATTGRFDGSSRGGTERFMARLAIAGTSRPDFIWSPYPDFISGLHQPATSLAAALTSALLPQLANELRFGWSRDAIAWDRAHPEVPTLIDTSPDGVILPGSLAFYAFRNRNQSFELADQAFRVSGRHILCGGGSVLVRSATGFLTAGQDGRYAFPTVVDFAIDQPSSFSVTLDRQSLPGLRLPQFAREYRYRQAAAFLQDTLRLSSRWTLNLGLSYEYFGAPNNTGDTKDGMVTLGAGGSFPEKLHSAGITIPSSGSEPLYRASHRDWSARAGFAQDLRGDSRTVLRGGWGIFYDRPFDNLWQNQRNNNLALATFDYQAGPGGYLAPIASLLPRYAKQQVISDFPVLTMFQPNWKTGYA